MTVNVQMLKYGYQIDQFYILHTESEVEYIKEFNINSIQPNSMVSYHLWTSNGKNITRGNKLGLFMLDGEGVNHRPW